MAFPEESLSPSLVDDILLTAMSRPLTGARMKELKYMFRVREKETELSKASVFYNCFVYYRQEAYGKRADLPPSGSETASFGVGDESRLLRQAVVLVSRWPFPQLAFRLLCKLDEGLVWQADPSAAAAALQAAAGG
eukprot:CAMPEP_0173204770 /NCGR_PEP_ID=MMETSP1141-20130122/20327_1 /TAXON_ID=483371 /ORGANISM="non described non described, Strain CCMP2298" /LENGTH=135 /DNA_ID=CAMNT_0014130511 /DNA_START=9 /DNA_END=412 /DNA_ORIENTATION=-